MFYIFGGIVCRLKVKEAVAEREAIEGSRLTFEEAGWSVVLDWLQNTCSSGLVTAAAEISIPKAKNIPSTEDLLAWTPQSATSDVKVQVKSSLLPST